MRSSRISGFYRLDAQARIRKLEEAGWLGAADATSLRNGRHVLSVGAANTMIENVISTFSLPLAIAPNFIVNGEERLVPLVVEEPSIVAALSSAARIARRTGGFTVVPGESFLTGQIHIANPHDTEAAMSALLEARHELLRAANAVHPRMLARGGGAKELEVRKLGLEAGEESLVVHLQVDTRDAMGANLVNTMCEAIAPAIAAICEGDVALRILTNLSDRSLVTARAVFALADLADHEASAITVRDAIVRADRIAHADPYRAATHNKGILNGIDPLAIATGNDWRAIEAGAHAYAAAAGHYSSLTRWTVADNGDLAGQIRLPLKPGIVGGTVATNAAAATCLRLSGVASARELAELMAAVGLAQNFAALRALCGDGIQSGHMRLHARSVAMAAGAPAGMIDELVTELVDSGEIKEWKARELLQRRRCTFDAGEVAAGKVILLGEHAVVYGRHALALPIPAAVRAVAVRDEREQIAIPSWGICESIAKTEDRSPVDMVRRIAEELGVGINGVSIRLDTQLPRAMGLGSSAAIAVAITRALARLCDLGIDNAEVNRIAFECEKLAHGTPSGVDNTLACFARPVLYRRADVLTCETLDIPEPPPIVIAYGSQPGKTLEQVSAVRARRERQLRIYESLFDEIDALSLAGTQALLAGDYAELGAMMNICHGLLNAIEVSTPELETMVTIARESGAVGAKLTGAGGGGSVVALCPGNIDKVRAAFHAAGYQTL